MSNLVRIADFKQAEIILSLEAAVLRAKAGQIDGYLMVEIGKDDSQLPSKVRFTTQMQDVTDPISVLAVSGGLGYLGGRMERAMSFESDDD